MTDSPRALARDLQSSFAVLEDVPLNEITAQIKSLRAAGMDDDTMYEAVPRMFQLKHAVEDQLDSDTDTDTTNDTPTDAEPSSSSNLAPEEIRVHYLPDKYDRDDWA